MRAFSIRIFSAILLLALFAGCANIVPPTGGKKDVDPPKLLEIEPKDSMLNIRVTRIDMRFDEFIALGEPGKEINISPVMPIPLNTLVNGKKMTLKIPDSLLKENTTYRISFGNAIKDLNENNVFKDYNYIFSTGGYFDSLKIYGIAYEAATGKPAENVQIILYEADKPDSVIVKEKPVYVTKTLSGGRFLLPGLPYKAYRIYALMDKNENLVYDGEEEKIGFVDSIIFPVDSVIIAEPIVLRVFKEIPPVDTVLDNDSVGTSRSKFGRGRVDKADTKELRYSVGVDTSNVEKRTHDINKPIKITFNNAIDTYNTGRVFVTYDSAGIDVESEYSLIKDTTKEIMLLDAVWKENTVYTIRLLKDFALDTMGLSATPSKYIFRTKGDDDYGVIKIHVASKYYGNKYLLMVTAEKDTVYKKAINDTTVNIRRLSPGKYTLAIIVDENENGKWDTGDLFAKLQPEMVVPFADVIELKAGWENVIDFKEPVKEDPKAKLKPKSKAGTPPVKGDKR